MRVLVLIPTHRRPAMLRDLIGDIRRETPRDWKIEVAVVEDWTPDVQYNDVIKGMVQWWSPIGPCGIYKYHEIINELWRYAQYSGWDRVCQLADDFRLREGFFLEMEDLWQSIDDKWKICLNPAVDTARVNQMCWSRFYPVRIERVLLTQWNDLAFWAERDMLAALNFTMARARNNKGTGSGVGSQMTKRLINLGYHLYQVPITLVSHGNHPSVMNPKFRESNPLVT